MANEDKSPKTAAPAVAPAVTPVVAAAAPPPPPPMGIFDEVKTLENATSGTSARHTFGAWCRAKGVRPQQVKAAMDAGTLKIASAGGDGPEMTEQEFDRAVDFQYATSFGQLPPQRTHIPADLARGGAGQTAEDEAAAADAAAKSARKT